MFGNDLMCCGTQKRSQRTGSECRKKFYLIEWLWGNELRERIGEEGKMGVPEEGSLEEDEEVEMERDMMMFIRRPSFLR